MERIVYDTMAELDDRHWWYRARREVLAALIRRRAPPPAGAQLLEIGSGTGHNLAMLGQFGHVDALELDAAARAIALKDKFVFKAEMDDEARRHMFKHLSMAAG